MTIFTKKPATPPQPKLVSGTDIIRAQLKTQTRRRSLRAVAGDLNDIAGETANRLMARTIASNMAGPDASPETVTALAKTTFNSLSVSNVRIVSEAALQSFVDGTDLLADVVKVALAEYLHGGLHHLRPRQRPTKTCPRA
jgi:hypothetical protein